MLFNLWIQDVDSICEIFILFVSKKQDCGDKSLVCSMITISENAALRRTLSAQK